MSPYNTRFIETAKVFARDNLAATFVANAAYAAKKTNSTIHKDGTFDERIDFQYSVLSFIDSRIGDQLQESSEGNGISPSNYSTWFARTFLDYRT